MKIWMTGASGLLGRALCRLLDQKHIAYVASSRGDVDIGDWLQVEDTCAQVRPSHIINCAAYTQVDQAEVEREKAFRANVEGVVNLGKIASREGISLLHLSTDHVFKGDTQIPYRENDACHPINTYGISKRQGEEELFKIFPEACIVRTSWVFGEGGKNFLSTLVEKVKTSLELRLVADQQSRITYAPDLASAVVSLLDHQGIYHFANQGVLSLFDIASAIASRLRFNGHPCATLTPIAAKSLALPAERPPYSALNTEKFEQTVGWMPRTWEEVIDAIV